MLNLKKLLRGDKTLAQVEFSGYCNECKSYFTFSTHRDIDIKKNICTDNLECFCSYCGKKAKLIDYLINYVQKRGW